MLKELVLNQTRFFDGQEKRLSQVLLNCRAHGTNMVGHVMISLAQTLNYMQISGSAEDALRAVMEVLDTQALMIALLELTDEWLRDPIPVTRRDSTKYQPTPAASAFQCIGKTVIKMAGDASIFLPAFLPLAVRVTDFVLFELCTNKDSF